jgi:hypothetical protein
MLSVTLAPDFSGLVCVYLRGGIFTPPRDF